MQGGQMNIMLSSYTNEDGKLTYQVLGNGSACTKELEEERTAWITVRQLAHLYPDSTFVRWDGDMQTSSNAIPIKDAIKQVVNSEAIRAKIFAAITQWDSKQAKRKGYNKFGPMIALRRLDDVMSAIEQGEDVKQAVTEAYNDRLLVAILKVLGIAE